VTGAGAVWRDHRSLIMCAGERSCLLPEPCPDHGQPAPADADRARARLAAKIAATLPDAAYPARVAQRWLGKRVAKIHLAAVRPIRRPAVPRGYRGGRRFERAAGETLCLRWKSRATRLGAPAVIPVQRKATCPQCIETAAKYGIAYPAYAPRSAGQPTADHGRG